MPIQFITADQRMAAAAERPVNIVIAAPAGGGKTSQARTLDPSSTLFMNLEAGDLALADWGGTVVNVREEAQRLNVHPWEFCRGVACLLAGPDPAAAREPAKPGYFYSQAMFEMYAAHIAPPDAFAGYRTIFWDSITVAGRWSFAWAQQQPDAISEKTGKYDGRGVYGRHGQEMVTWLTTIQHTPKKSTVVSVILDRQLDDFGRLSFSLQIDGSKTGNELPGIFDEVLTLGLFKIDNGQPALDFQKGTERAFVCHLTNGYGVPAKDRSGKLDLFEPPNLGALIEKIRAAGPRKDALVTAMPQAQQPAA